MDEKKILIMNLSKGLVGETNANSPWFDAHDPYLSGGDESSRLCQSSRCAQMPNFYFYVDEFQSFANCYICEYSV
jgi:hypothetical protein